MQFRINQGEGRRLVEGGEGEKKRERRRENRGWRGENIGSRGEIMEGEGRTKVGEKDKRGERKE